MLESKNSQCTDISTITLIDFGILSESSEFISHIFDLRLNQKIQQQQGIPLLLLIPPKNLAESHPIYYYHEYKLICVYLLICTTSFSYTSGIV